MKKIMQVTECDFCREPMEKEYITTEDVPNEGSSTIRLGKNYFLVGEQDYCSFECLISHINSVLQPPQEQSK